MNYINKNVYNIILIVSGLTFLTFCFPFVAWILLGAILSFAIKPIQNKFLIKKLKMNSKVSVYVVLSGVLLILIPFILSSLTFFYEGRKIYEKTSATESMVFIEKSVGKVYETLPMLTSLAPEEQVIARSTKGLKKLVEPLLKLISEFFLSLPMLFLGLFVFSMSMFYFISDSGSFYTFISKLDVVETDELNRLIQIIQMSCQSTIFASFITGATQSLIISLVALMLGFNFFFTVFFITLFFAQIPIIGTLPVVLGLLGYFYGSGDVFATFVILTAGIVAGLSDNVIRPWVLSAYDSLHPFAGLMASIGALIIFGPIGVLLGPVITLLFVKVLKEKYKISTSI
jgi:predicted PurR-regulated permease PerM